MTKVVVGGGVDVAHVQVVDDGPGIAEADRDRVFDRFARGSDRGRGSLPGSGLGLSIAKESVQAEGGGLTCENLTAGGARFTVVLPQDR